jgi:hypothetical protein
VGAIFLACVLSAGSPPQSTLAALASSSVAAPPQSTLRACRPCEGDRDGEWTYTEREGGYWFRYVNAARPVPPPPVLRPMVMPMLFAPQGGGAACST